MQCVYVLVFHVISVCLSQLDILLNGRVVDALASVVHRDKAYSTGKAVCIKLKDTIHRYGICAPSRSSYMKRDKRQSAYFTL